MTKIILTTISILSLMIMVTISSAVAEEKYTIIEMGEGGYTVSFPMTSEEIAALEADNERLMKIGALISETVTQSLITIEMGESGQTASFPVTAKETGAEGPAIIRFSDNREESNSDERRSVYEMAESGELIEFTRPVSKEQTVNLAGVK